MDLLGSFFFIFPRPILSKLIEEREEGTYTKAYFELDSGIDAAPRDILFSVGNIHKSPYSPPRPFSYPSLIYTLRISTPFPDRGMQRRGQLPSPSILPRPKKGRAERRRDAMLSGGKRKEGSSTERRERGGEEEEEVKRKGKKGRKRAS